MQNYVGTTIHTLAKIISGNANNYIYRFGM